MEMVQILWLLRIIIGLAIGFITARKLRDFIRSIVIMCIPLKYRISERSFQVQTRITTIVAILVAIGIAVGLNYGLSMAMNKVGITEKITLIDANLTPPFSLVKKKQPSSKVSPKIVRESPISNPIEAEPFEEMPTSYELPQKIKVPQSTSISQTTDMPLHQYQKHFGDYSSPNQKQPTTNYQIPHYVQLYAFRSFNKAKQQQIHWNQSIETPVWVGFNNEDNTPYKVIIGPFRNRLAAAYFLKRNRLSGFPKPAYQLKIFRNE